MANCPNCGRSTAKTKDWCCQWCGYPLFSGSYKTINKTYKELKAERTALLSEDEIVKDKNQHKLDNKVEEKNNKIEEQIKPDDRHDVVEKEVDKQAVPRTQPVIKPKPSIEIRRIRKVRYDPPSPVRRRIIRKHKPAPAPESEIEYIEYIDEPENDSEEYYEEYEEESEVDEEDEYEYEEEEPRAVRKPAPDIRPVRKAKPVPRHEANHPVRREIPGKPGHVPAPDPEIDEYLEDIEVPEDEFEETKEQSEDDRVEVSDEPDEVSGDLVKDSINGTHEKQESKDDEKEVPRPEVKPVIPQVTMDITVDELVSAYEMEGPDADVRFANKVMKITGITAKIEIKEALAVYVLILEASNANPLQQTVRCVFSRENKDKLQLVTKGQTVSVQGKYDGSIVNISMRDCFLV